MVKKKSIFWTDKDLSDIVGEEILKEGIDEDILDSLHIWDYEYGYAQVINREQVDYISKFMTSKIELNRYEYFVEFHKE